MKVSHAINVAEAFRDLYKIEHAVEMCADGRGLSTQGAIEARRLLESLRGIVRQVARSGSAEVVGGPPPKEPMLVNGSCLDCGLGQSAIAELGHRKGCLWS
jgi:hypothetical protein